MFFGLIFHVTVLETLSRSDVTVIVYVPASVAFVVPPMVQRLVRSSVSLARFVYVTLTVGPCSMPLYVYVSSVKVTVSRLASSLFTV